MGKNQNFIPIPNPIKRGSIFTFAGTLLAPGTTLEASTSTSVFKNTFLMSKFKTGDRGLN